MTSVEIQDMEDLEDGEIESDGEQPTDEVVQPSAPTPAPAPVEPAPCTVPPSHPDRGDADERLFNTKPPNFETKRDKKKFKEHHHKEDREFRSQKKEKARKFLLPTPVEDDYAGNIEKAIRLALKQGSDDLIDYPQEEKFQSSIHDSDSKRKHKKRKKHDQSEKESSKKRKKREDTRPKGDDEMDEDEMMCIRGASPVLKQDFNDDNPYDNYQSEEEFESEESEDCGGTAERRGGRGGGGRGNRGGRGGDRRPRSTRRQDVHPSQDPDGVCLFYMQGKCYKGDDCTFSHDAHPPRKMELCKFYLMDCCAKRDKCLYLHSDFPCKYYHTGLPCIYKDDCKFAHGKPLSDSLKNILLKHLESAPKEILGDFPRLSRDSASTMVTMTQNKLIQQYSPLKSNSKDKGIPSIFELNVPKPMGYDENQINNYSESSQHDKNKNYNKIRQSRWCVSNSSSPLLSTPPNAAQNILNIQNLTGVLTPHQISELVNLGIDNLNQLSQLTVIQLNQIGLTMNQINEIQLNTMSIQKLGLIHNQSSNSGNFPNNPKLNQDLDMRVSPILTDLKSNPLKSETLGQDVDMRFQHNSSRNNDNIQSDPRKQKNSVDIDQYTKDALKFSKIEKENITTSDNEYSNDNHSNINNTERLDSDIDHRVTMNYVRDATLANTRLSQEDSEDTRTESDSDIRVSKTLNLYSSKKNEQKSRRTTTDDEEDNLQIDEKWYSSDEDRSEKQVKIKSPPQEEAPKVYNPVLDTAMEPTTVITQLGDLSKIDISAEVTKLLSSIKNNSSEQSSDVPKKELPKIRDPRNIKKSPEHKISTETVKKITPKPGFVSIYNCVEGGSTDGRKRTDIDLRPIKDIDFRIPSFGDTDLRQTPGGGDVDLRLGLPFKPIPNYTPASEIDGSINSHPPIPFKLGVVDVPRPDYTDIKNSTPKSQAASDPRLRKIFRLSTEENTLEIIEKPAKPSNTVRIDPRKRTQESIEKPNPAKPPPLDLQVIIQSSTWYKDLGTNQKILVNQQLASVTASLKKFHQTAAPGKLFDLTEIKANIVLTSIFTNLGIVLNEKGEFTQLKLSENASPVMPPMNFNQNENFTGNNMPGHVDPTNMIGMNPMGPTNMGTMGNFDMRFQGADPRGAPGLLGIAPNIPHNFDTNNFNGMQNFNNDNSRMSNYNNDNSRMSNFNNENFNSNFDNSGMYNNSNNMNEFQGENNYEGNNYYRNQNKDFKSYRGGRGNNDRWRGNRGRERRGHSERGSWKGDRR